MTRRHPRRTARTVLAAASLLASLIPLVTASAPAAAATPAVTVAGIGTAQTGGTPLNIRESPSSASRKLGEFANGRRFSIICQVAGETVRGTVRTASAWDRLANGSYVSDAYVQRGPARIPVCGPPAGAWTVPLSAGLVSGFRTASRPTHDGVDLGAARWTPIRAAAAGRVIRVVCNISAGSCDVDGNRTLRGCGWYAEVQHAGNVVTRYCHMIRRPSVAVGQTVGKGQILGYVGSSGSSSGPHLHFEVHVNAPPATRANAVNPVWFLNARGVRLG
jgi:murein DD-endopeptidase MepM/ murein hydrolase activator NlpD